MKFVPFFVYIIDEIPAIFQTWSLARGQNTRILNYRVFSFLNTGKLGNHITFVTFFAYIIDEI